MENAPAAGDGLGGRKLAILGLPWETTVETLQAHFAQYGKVVDAVIMRDRASGRSRGFGFVTFETLDEAQSVIALSHEIDGRRVEAKVAVPKDPASNGAAGAGGAGAPTTRIFVARVAPTVTEEEFRRYFEEYGAITDAYMPKDHHTRRHRGIGFVTFEAFGPVDVIMKGTHMLGGQEVAIDRATPKTGTGYGGGMGRGPSMGIHGGRPYGMDDGRGGVRMDDMRGEAWRMGGMGMPVMMGLNGGMDYGGMGGVPPHAYNMGGIGMGGMGGMGMGGMSMGGMSGMEYGGDEMNGGRDIGGRGGGVAAGPPGAKIFVGRLDPSVTVQSLRMYFGKFGQLIDVYMPKDNTRNTHRGFGFVTFDSEMTAERVASQAHEINGRAVAIDRATPKEMGVDPKRGVVAPSMMSGGFGGPMGSPFGPMGIANGGIQMGGGGEFMAGAFGGMGAGFSGGGGPYRSVDRPGGVRGGRTGYKPY